MSEFVSLRVRAPLPPISLSVVFFFLSLSSFALFFLSFYYGFLEKSVLGPACTYILWKPSAPTRPAEETPKLSVVGEIRQREVDQQLWELGRANTRRLAMTWPKGRKRKALPSFVATAREKGRRGTRGGTTNY